MINVDYRIERDEGNEHVIYEPKLLPTEYENVVYIKGPNSSGKSTLLNLIATGFYGKNLSENDIDKSLRRKILSLLDLDHQKLLFNISIDHPNMGWILSASKTNPETTDITVKLNVNGNEKFLSSETFFNQFRLIYDIPSNPLERLPQILQDIKGAQQSIIGKLRNFRSRLNDLIIDIRSSKDPAKISELEDEIIKYSQEKNKVDHELNVLSKFQNKFLEYYLTRFYVENDRNVRDYSTKIKSLEDELAQAEKEGRQSAKVVTKVAKQIDREFGIALERYLDCEILLSSSLSKDEKEHLLSWKNASLENEVYQSEIFSTIRDETSYFLQNFKTGYEYQKQAFSKDLDKIEVYKKLLSALADIRYDNVTLPGVNQTVENFKELIIVELEALEEIEEKLNNIKVVIDKLSTFLESLNTVISTAQKFKELPKVGNISERSDFQTIRIKLREANKIKNKYEEITSGFRSKLIENSFDPTTAAKRFYDLSFDNDLKPYSEMSETSILEKINSLNLSITDKEQRLSKLEDFIHSKEDELTLMEAKEPHKYRDYLGSLEVFINEIQILERKFVQKFSKYIDHAIDEKKIDNEDELHYAKLLGDLLASKIDTLKHVDKIYKVENVDLQSGLITTKEGKKIKFEDLGTGQSQAAYIQAKLSMEDDRKIIALIDEVAMMDEQTLKPIKEKLVQLYNEEKLFMAIIVQKNDTVEIEGLL